MSTCNTTTIKTTSTTLECKKLLLQRCINAVGLSIALQFVLLTVFLLFVNFDIFHLILWITSTFSLMCSFSTWLAIIPLIFAVLVYGVILGKLHLAEIRYYPTRYRYLLHNALRKLLFLGAHLLVGFMTAWLYTSFLHVDYRHVLYNCYEQKCVNSYHTLLISAGIFAGFYHFVKTHLRTDVSTEFFLIHQKWVYKINGLLYSTLLNSLIKSFLPTILFLLGYWVVGSWLINRQLTKIFSAELDDRVDSFIDLATNMRLLFYAWLLTSQILSNMHLMLRFYSVLLSEPLPLIINKQQIVFEKSSEIILTDALGVSSISLVRSLATRYLYELGNMRVDTQRLEIFQLSQPGNHPVNWNKLNSQCLSIIRSFTDELTASMKRILAMKQTQTYEPITTPISQLTADRILLRQYNERHGIRSMTSPNQSYNMNSSCSNPGVTHIQKGGQQVEALGRRINARCEELSRQMQKTLKDFLVRIPGMKYMFEEPDGAKTIFLVNNSQHITWLVQGLAGVCAASLTEDRFGVVQTDLEEIIKVLIALKVELDKLNNLNINGRKLDRNFYALKSAVKRSLCIIGNGFGELIELRELITDQQDLRHLENTLLYQD